MAIIANGLTYLLMCAVVTGVVGLVNRRMRRPFFDGWRDRLFLVTTLYVGFLIADPLLRAVGFNGRHK